MTFFVEFGLLRTSHVHGLFLDIGLVLQWTIVH